MESHDSENGQPPCWCACLSKPQNDFRFRIYPARHEVFLYLSAGHPDPQRPRKSRDSDADRRRIGPETRAEHWLPILQEHLAEARHLSLASRDRAADFLDLGTMRLQLRAWHAQKKEDLRNLQAL